VCFADTLSSCTLRTPPNLLPDRRFRANYFKIGIEPVILSTTLSSAGPMARFGALPNFSAQLKLEHTLPLAPMKTRAFYSFGKAPCAPTPSQFQTPVWNLP
jgi:hypothetical protein